MSSAEPFVRDLRPRNWLEKWVAANTPSMQEEREKYALLLKQDADEAAMNRAETAKLRRPEGSNWMWLGGSVRHPKPTDFFIEEELAQKRRAQAKARQEAAQREAAAAAAEEMNDRAAGLHAADEEVLKDDA